MCPRSAAIVATPERTIPVNQQHQRSAISRKRERFEAVGQLRPSGAIPATNGMIALVDASAAAGAVQRIEVSVPPVLKRIDRTPFGMSRPGIRRVVVVTVT